MQSLNRHFPSAAGGGGHVEGVKHCTGNVFQTDGRENQGDENKRTSTAVHTEGIHTEGIYLRVWTVVIARHRYILHASIELKKKKKTVVIRGSKDI